MPCFRWHFDVNDSVVVKNTLHFRGFETVLNQDRMILKNSTTNEENS